VNLVPRKMFLTKGVGYNRYKLKSFEDALRQAGVAQQNLVTVSSILPPKCKVISCKEGLKQLKPGSICFCVLARAETNEPGRMIASSIGVAVPKDPDKWGYLSEVHEYGMTKPEAGDMAEDLAAGMLATTLGLDLDADKDWSEKEQAYKSSGLFVRTSNMTQTAKGKNGNWVTTVALAVFLFE